MRLNALWWWIDRWRKSTAYTDMTLEQQGGYRNLLDEAQLRGGALPNDERILAKACGDAPAWRRLRSVLMARFELREDGWHNETLDEVIRESRRRAEKQANWRKNRGNAPGNTGGNSSGNAPGNGHGNRGGSPDPSPSPVPQPNDRKEVERANAPPILSANPLVDRDALVSEGNRLISSLAAVEDLDPTEVLLKASAWNGRGRSRLDTMTDDRLAQTVAKLRSWDRTVRGETEPGPPEAAVGASPKALQREAGMAAMAKGGMRQR